MDNDKAPKPKRRGKFLLVLVCVLAFIGIAWVAFSLIGRVNSGTLIPEGAVLRVSIAHPVRLIDKILSHESLEEMSSVPALAQAIPLLKSLEESHFYKSRFVRFAAGGSLELALLPHTQDPSGLPVLAWDMGLCSPLLRILPVLSNFISIPHLYYVQAGKNSRFEYRMGDKVFYIGSFRNVLFVSGSAAIYESRVAIQAHENKDGGFTAIKPSTVDLALLFSPDFLDALLADQHEDIAAVLGNVELGSVVEAGLLVSPKKLELRVTAPVSSTRPALSRLLEKRSHAPLMAERLPAAVQYATILSAGTLEELYEAAQVFSGPGLADSLRRADNSSRFILGLSLDELLFSWSGDEFAAFGMEGRPHPVYAIKIENERKRQEVFDKAFKSIALNENVRLNLDGTRIPRIEVPDFLQALLRQWDLILPSPCYFVHRDYLLVSESAETLLVALRAIQRNDVLPRTAAWRTIAGSKASSSAFSLYYSLDLSMPFFLRGQTLLSSFLGLYRQGFLRMNFDRGLVDISLSLVPGSGSGVTLVNAVPLDTLVRGNISNQVYGLGREGERRVLLSAGNSAFTIDYQMGSMQEFSGQGSLWVLPSEERNAWVVSTQGRVTLVNADMEAAQGFPVLTGLRLTSPPAVYNGRVYLADEDGKVHTVDPHGAQSTWETSFPAALRSPPSFLSVQAGRTTRTYAAVYPKSFFGEIWLLDSDGKALPNWPAPLESGLEQDGLGMSSGIGFGSPLLFAHNNRVRVAFVSQAGELLVFDEAAAFAAPFPLLLDGVFYQQPVFDGEYLWLVSSNGTLFRVSLDGEVLQQNIPGFSVKEEGYITVFDSDGDKIPEIFITGEGNALHAYSRNFRSLEGFPLPVWGRPLFIAGTGGSKNEIIGLGMDRRLYRWQFK